MRAGKDEQICRHTGKAGLVLAFCLAAGSMFLTGCYRHEVSPIYDIPIDNEDRHPIKLRQNVNELHLNVNEGVSGLSSAQQSKLAQFFMSYRQVGQGQIQVVMPSGSANDSSVYETAAAIKNTASRSGIAPAYLSIRTYSATMSENPLVRISYNYTVAKGPVCGDWSENLGENHTNEHYYNFGCAQQRNLAAMIANPNDLKQPRGIDSRSSERRDVIWDKYIKGETTVSKRSAEEKGTISEVAK